MQVREIAVEETVVEEPLVDQDPPIDPTFERTPPTAGQAVPVVAAEPELPVSTGPATGALTSQPQLGPTTGTTEIVAQEGEITTPQVGPFHDMQSFISFIFLTCMAAIILSTSESYPLNEKFADGLVHAEWPAGSHNRYIQSASYPFRDFASRCSSTSAACYVIATSLAMAMPHSAL